MRQSHAQVDKSEEACLGIPGLHKPGRGRLGAGGRYHPPYAEAFRIPKLNFRKLRNGEVRRRPITGYSLDEASFLTLSEVYLSRIVRRQSPCMPSWEFPGSGAGSCPLPLLLDLIQEIRANLLTVAYNDLVTLRYCEDACH